MLNPRRYTCPSEPRSSQRGGALVGVLLLLGVSAVLVGTVASLVTNRMSVVDDLLDKSFNRYLQSYIDEVVDCNRTLATPCQTGSNQLAISLPRKV